MRHPYLPRTRGRALILVACLATACDEGTRPTLDVRRTSPAAGALGVDPATTVKVGFSYRVDMASVDASSFQVRGEVSGPAEGHFTAGDAGRWITFHPANAFAAGEEVTVVLTSAVRSSSGAPIEAFSFGFRIAESAPPSDDPGESEPPGPEPLAVIRRSPERNAQAVPLGTGIEIEFSAPLNPFTVTPEMVRARGELSGPVPLEIEGALNAGTSLRAVPERAFTPGERVWVEIRRGIASADGAVFPGETYRFRTEASPPPFGARASLVFAAAGRIADVLAVDLDGDGQAELAYRTETGGVLEVVRYDPVEERLETVFTYKASGPILSLQAGDADGDGALDFLVGLADRLLPLVQQVAAGGDPPVFEAGAPLVTGSPVRGAWPADLDHTGARDLVLSTEAGVRVRRGGFSGGTLEPVGLALARTPVAVADLDGDGHADIVYGDSGRTITYHLGSDAGDGSFGDGVAAAVPGDPEELAIDDLDGDGHAEILVRLAGSPFPPALPFHVLAWDPTSRALAGGLAQEAQEATTLESGPFALGDLDGDRILDLVSAETAEGEVGVAYGGPFPPQALEPLVSLPEPSALALGDLDRDGSLDLAIASGNELRVLRSGAAPPEPPPSPAPTVSFRAANVRARQGETGVRALVILENDVPLDAVSVMLRYDPRVVANPAADLTSTVLEPSEFVTWDDDATGGTFAFHALLDFLPPLDGKTVAPGSDRDLLRMVFDVPLEAPPGESPLELPEGEAGGALANSAVSSGETLAPELAGATIAIDARDVPPPSGGDRLAAGTATAAQGTTVRIPVTAVAAEPIDAFSAIVAFDPSVLDVLDISIQDTATAALSPELAVPEIRPAEGYLSFSVIFDLLPPYEGKTLAAEDPQVLFWIEARAASHATPGFTPLVLTDGLGTPPLDNMFSRGGVSIAPELEHGGVEITDAPDEPVFVRGDVNGDRRVDAADAVTLLGWLFGNGTVLPCLDAADVDDDGSLTSADAQQVLAFVLYGSTTPPAPPFPEPGPDPTPDGLFCLSPPAY